MAIDLTIVRKKINPNYYGNSFSMSVYNKTENSNQTIVGEGDKPHVEKGTIGDSPIISDHDVLHLFNEDFVEQPIEVVLQVFKWVLQADSSYSRQNVPWGYKDASQPLITGFEILINEEFTPDLTGVIIKYKFEEL